MSYASEAALSVDAEYSGRVRSSIVTESRSRVGEALADQVLRSPGIGVNMFMPWLSTAPGFGDKYDSGGQEAIDDTEILAAVQASWADVAAVNTPTP